VWKKKGNRLRGEGKEKADCEGGGGGEESRAEIGKKKGECGREERETQMQKETRRAPKGGEKGPQPAKESAAEASRQGKGKSIKGRKKDLGRSFPQGEGKGNGRRLDEARRKTDFYRFGAKRGAVRVGREDKGKKGGKGELPPGGAPGLGGEIERYRGKGGGNNSTTVPQKKKKKKRKIRKR